MAILLNCSKRFFGRKFQIVYCGERGTEAVGHVAAYQMPTQTDQDTALDADYKMGGICTEQEMSFLFKLKRIGGSRYTNCCRHLPEAAAGATASSSSQQGKAAGPSIARQLLLPVQLCAVKQLSSSSHLQHHTANSGSLHQLITQLKVFCSNAGLFCLFVLK